MGVWIETKEFAAQYQEYPVTPCVGVWIETKAIQKALERG